MEGSPEDLAYLITSLAVNPNERGHVDTTLEESDNELTVQILLSTFKHLMSVIPDDQRDMMITYLNIGLAQVGYMIRLEHIKRTELSTIVYYARITPEMEVLRSQFHPLHLMTHMPESGIPESFKLLFENSNYLPNIITAWDRGYLDTVSLLTFQKVNVHYSSVAPVQSM